jgi:hypothetical protein
MNREIGIILGDESSMVWDAKVLIGAGKVFIEWISFVIPPLPTHEYDDS